jgi:TetR/AcrR family transcriptional repressor of nem operon
MIILEFVGRTRSYDQDAVLGRTADLFARTGYECTSIDDVVAATGLHRGSLYAAFGSKRGLFRAALQRAVAQRADRADDLLLVALLELAPRDLEIRADCRLAFGELFADEPARLGRHLLARAGLNTQEE